MAEREAALLGKNIGWRKLSPHKSSEKFGAEDSNSSLDMFRSSVERLGALAIDTGAGAGVYPGSTPGTSGKEVISTDANTITHGGGEEENFQERQQVVTVTRNLGTSNPEAASGAPVPSEVVNRNNEKGFCQTSGQKKREVTGKVTQENNIAPIKTLSSRDVSFSFRTLPSATAANEEEKTPQRIVPWADNNSRSARNNCAGPVSQQFSSSDVGPVLFECQRASLRHGQRSNICLG